MTAKKINIFAACAMATLMLTTSGFALASEVSGTLSAGGPSQVQDGNTAAAASQPQFTVAAPADSPLSATNIGLGILVGLVVLELIALLVIDSVKKRKRAIKTS